MHWLFFLSVVAGLSVVSQSVSLLSDSLSQFEKYRLQFNKKYDTDQLFETRFLVFRDNVRAINAHNMNPLMNFTMSVNQFSDWTELEFSDFVKKGGYKTPEGLMGGTYGCSDYSHTASASTPDSVDWVAKGGVTSVKDQGQCGSCWTFSATGAVEGAWFVSSGALIDLSEEQLVDCATGVAYGSHGCNGGQMEGAFKYVIQNGQCSLTSYPYSAGSGKSGTCKQSTCSQVASMSKCFDVKPNDQVSLKSAVSNQPVAVAIEADTRYFQSYSGGILTAATECGTTLDHGVLIVGYGDDNGQAYWLVKNSWGTTWGDNGYVKIARTESTNDAGVCGIAMDPSFIVV